MNKKLTPQQVNKIKRLADLASKGNIAIVQYLFELEDKLDIEIPQIKDLISRVKGDKGDNYILTDKDKNDIASSVDVLVNRSDIAKDAHNLIDYEAIATAAAKKVKVPTPKDGETPSDARLNDLIKAQLPEVNEDNIATKASEMAQAAVKDILPDELEGIEIVSRINDIKEDDDRYKIDREHIRGLEDWDDVVKFSKSKGVIAPVYLSGSNGIKGLVAGTNITIDNSNPQYPKISSTGGGGGGTWGTITGTISAQTDLQPYIRGSISLTTTGTSGAATYNSTTGVLNIPNYANTTYSAGTGLTLTTTTFSVNTSQNISTLSNLTSNGLIKTSGGTGALSIATAGTDYQAPITLTTTGTSGAATFIGNTLNIPQYTGGGGGSSVTKSIAQTAHGLTLGQIVRYNGTSYVAAKSDTTANAEAVGIVSTVTDANNFIITTHGYVSGLSGLTAGENFLSAGTAGLLTTTAPSTVGQVSKPMFFADSTTSGYLINYRGITVAAPGENVLTFTSGLTRATNTITNDLITGKSGGQTVIGGTASGENLTLQSTSNATKGKVIVDTTTLVVDEVNHFVGFGTATPANPIHAKANSTTLTPLRLEQTNSTGPLIEFTGTTGSGLSIVTEYDEGIPILSYLIAARVNGSNTDPFTSKQFYVMMGGPDCFPAGTMVLMEDGTEKKIEDVVVGDRTMSMNESVGMIFGSEVSEILHHKSRPGTIMVDVNDGDLIATSNHKTFINGSYKPLDKLRLGDYLTTSTNEKIWVHSIREFPVPTYFPTYNFKKAGPAKNYFVRSKDKIILVHNKCPFLFFYDEKISVRNQEAAYVDQGTFLTNFEGKEKEGVSLTKLKNISNKFVVAECEPETSFIKDMKLIAHTPKGEVELKWTNRPEGEYVVTKGHKSQMLVMFEDVPEGTTELYLSAEGYYNWQG